MIREDFAGDWRGIFLFESGQLVIQNMIMGILQKFDLDQVSGFFQNLKQSDPNASYEVGFFPCERDLPVNRSLQGFYSRMSASEKGTLSVPF